MEELMEDFASTYRRHYAGACRYARTLVRDADEAEDVVQEAFLRGYEALAAYEDRGTPLRAWLFRIVHNVAVRRLERSARVRVTDRPYAAEPAVPAATPAGGLDALLAGLPEAQRQVLVLRFLLDLSAAETAHVLDRTPEGVRQLQQRALRTLRRRLGAAATPSPSRPAPA